MAFDYATARGVPMTAGSDAHHEAAIGTAFTILETQDFSVKGILNQVKVRTDLAQRYMTVRDAIRKTWNNCLRLRRKRVHISVEPTLLR